MDPVGRERIFPSDPIVSDCSVPIGTFRIRLTDFIGKHLKQSECVGRKPTESDCSVLSDLVPIRQDPMPPTSPG